MAMSSHRLIGHLPAVAAEAAAAAAAAALAVGSDSIEAGRAVAGGRKESGVSPLAAAAAFAHLGSDQPHDSALPA